MPRPRLATWLTIAIATHATAYADPPRPPKLWAIVVGIDSQDDATIDASPGAASDARAVRRWLVEEAGWDGSQVLMMLPSSPKSHGAASQQIEQLRPSREEPRMGDPAMAPLSPPPRRPRAHLLFRPGHRGEGG